MSNDTRRFSGLTENFFTSEEFRNPFLFSGKEFYGRFTCRKNIEVRSHRDKNFELTISSPRLIDKIISFTANMGRIVDIYIKGRLLLFLTDSRDINFGITSVDGRVVFVDNIILNNELENYYYE